MPPPLLRLKKLDSERQKLRIEFEHARKRAELDFEKRLVAADRERERERERNATDWGSIAANVTSAITLGVTEYIRTNGERGIARVRERERE